MTTEQLLKICAEREVKIELKEDRLVIAPGSKRDGITDALLRVLKRHRDNIIRICADA